MRMSWLGLPWCGLVLGLADLATTYSPASWDEVPSALGPFTAEFGMASGAAAPQGSPGRPRTGHWAFVVRAPRAWSRRAIKPIEPLVPVGSAHRGACTPGLSTWSSSTALKGELVLRRASRLDAFSGYPIRT